MVFTRKWWALVLRGLAAILFGIIAFVVPGLTLRALIVLFAAYALTEGVLSIAAAINRTDRTDHWGAMLARGILDIVAGFIAIAVPGITAMVLLYVVAAWAIITGLFEISAAVRLRREIRGEWLLALSGALSIVFGVAVMLYPATGILALVWLIGAYAVADGIVMTGLGLSLRSRRSPEFEVGRRAA